MSLLYVHTLEKVLFLLDTVFPLLGYFIIIYVHILCLRDMDMTGFHIFSLSLFRRTTTDDDTIGREKRTKKWACEWSDKPS